MADHARDALRLLRRLGDLEREEARSLAQPLLDILFESIRDQPGRDIGDAIIAGTLTSMKPITSLSLSDVIRSDMSDLFPSPPTVNQHHGCRDQVSSSQIRPPSTQPRTTRLRADVNSRVVR